MTTRTDFAAPLCSIEIYPQRKGDAGLFAITGGQIQSVSTSKDYTSEGGQFTIVLAPGGPASFGPDSDWTSVIAPMSLVLIGMQRAGRANIVMVGVVTSVSGGATWGDSGVQRPITITGEDFSYYFTQFNYFAMGALGLLPGTVQGSALGIGPVAAQQLLGAGFTSGTPQQIASNFISQAMFGSGYGLMQKTSVQFGNRAPLTLLDIFSTAFEEYPGSVVQLDYDYVTTEETWYAKFQNIFPSPFYEFFITSAPNGYYAKGVTPLVGLPFTMATMPNAGPVSVTAVARINPSPVLTVGNASTGRGATITGVDSTRWQALTTFTPDELRPRVTNISFEIGETANYFAINPTYAGTMYGAGNSMANTILLTQNTAIDTNSIIDFGFRPAVIPTAWYGDGTGATAQNSNIQENFAQISAELIARIASTFGPQHLMANATVTLPLRPDIMVGQKFTFNPFKQDQTWDFHIKSVSHTFNFGSESTTTLVLERGLPSSIYNSGSPSTPPTRSGQSVQVDYGSLSIQSILDGTAVRTGFGYKVLGDRAGVQFFGPNSNLQAIFGQISSAFNNPGH